MCQHIGTLALPGKSEAEKENTCCICLVERPETLLFPIFDAHDCTISRQNLTVRDQKDFPVASFHTHLFPGARKDLSKKRDLDRNNLLKIAPDQAQEIANGPHLDVYQVPGHRTQHLELRAFDVKAEVVDLGVVQGQEQAEENQVCG